MVGNRILNVLMIEDDEVDVMNVQRLFQRANLTNPLLIANNGRAAMSLIESEVIPLLGQQSSQQINQNCWMILLDINLPQMNGIELLQQLSQNPAFASIPVILLISLPEDQERLHNILKSNGIEVFGYMMKPIKADRLIETLAIVEQYWEMQI